MSWLGSIPDHWSVVPLRTMFRFVKRPYAQHREVLSVYRDFGVIEKNTRTDNYNQTPDDLSTYQTVFAGGIIVNKMKAWQGSLGISAFDGITSPDYAGFEPLVPHDRGYINNIIRCNLLPDSYRSISNGIRPNQRRLELDKFKEMRIPLPPIEEQKRISNFIESLVLEYRTLTNERKRRSCCCESAVLP